MRVVPWLLLGAAFWLLLEATVDPMTLNERRAQWEDNRRRDIGRLMKIARKLDDSKDRYDIANFAGSSVGVVGGGMMLGGLLFPPLVIPGIAMSLVGLGGKVWIELERIKSVKGLAAEAQHLLEQDAYLLNAFLNELNSSDQLAKVLSKIAYKLFEELEAMENNNYNNE